MRHIPVPSDFVKLGSEILTFFWQKNGRLFYFGLFVAILRLILANFFINCSSLRAEKDAFKYLYITMDRFQTVGISRFQF